MIPTPYTPTPPFSIPNPFSQMPEEVSKAICSKIDEYFVGELGKKDSKLTEKIKEYVLSDDMLYQIAKQAKKHLEKYEKGYSKHEEAEESPMEELYDHIHKHQKEVHEGKAISEVEANFHKKHPSLSANEKRVFSSLLRTDGPYTLSQMIGMPYDDYVKCMRSIGEKLIKED